MAENSFAWAKSKNLLRVNEVHTCEEARLVLEEKYSNKSERGSMKSLTSEGEVEDQTPTNPLPEQLDTNPIA